MRSGATEIKINEYTASTTLSLADKSNLVQMTVATANVVTVPLNATVAFSVGANIGIEQKGAGITTITGATGVTINGISAGSGAMANQHDVACLIYKGSDVWSLIGTDTVA